MDRTEIRLECIKAAVRTTNDHGDAVKRAGEYFDFVTEKKIEIKLDNAKVPSAEMTAGIVTAPGPG